MPILGWGFFLHVCLAAVQVRGLIGAHGISPAQAFLDAVWNHFRAVALWRLPTLCWLGASDGVLMRLGVAGLVISLVMLAGFAPGGCTLALCLSLTSVLRAAAAPRPRSALQISLCRTG